MPTEPTSQGQATATEQHPSTVSEAKQVVNELRHDLEEQVSRGRERAMRQSQEFAQQQKERAAEEVHVFGSAIRAAADTLHEEKHGQIAGYVEACADELESVSTYLRERRFEELYHDANRIARRHPEIFLGGMFLAGVAITRFLKASQPEPEDYLDDEFTTGDSMGTMGTGPMMDTPMAGMPTMEDPLARESSFRESSYADPIDLDDESMLNDPLMEDPMLDEPLAGGPLADPLIDDLDSDDQSYVGGTGITPGTSPAEPPKASDVPGTGTSANYDLSDQGTQPPEMDDPTKPEVPPSAESSERIDPTNPTKNKKYDL